MRLRIGGKIWGGKIIGRSNNNKTRVGSTQGNDTTFNPKP